MFKRILVLIVFTIAASAVVNGTYAASAVNERLAYQVYGGGLRLLGAELMIFQDQNSYQMQVNAQTSGFARFISAWRGTIVSEGRVTSAGQLMPEFHESLSVWRDNTAVRQFHYDPQGAVRSLSLREHGQDITTEELRTLGDNTIDIFTMALRVMNQANTNGRCDSQATVYDGKRRFIMSISHEGQEQMQASRQNIYSGPAIRCRVQIEPDGGEWAERLRGWMLLAESGRDPADAPLIWLAPLREGGLYLPVRMRVQSQYGAFLVHLADPATLH